MRSRARYSVEIAAALLILGLALSACGTSASPSSAVSASSSPTASQPQPSVGAKTGTGTMADFRLFDVPPYAQVAFARDTVVWGSAAESDDCATHFTSFNRYDVLTGKKGPDPWLSALLGGHDVDAWRLAGDAVAWCDSTVRVKADGGMRVGARIEVARRPSTTPSPVTDVSWGQESESDGYNYGASLSDFNGRLVAFYDSDFASGPAGSPPKTGPAAGLWAVDTVTGRRCRLASPGTAGFDVIAMSGDTVYWAAGLTYASDFGSRDIWVRSLSTAGAPARHLRAPLRATQPAAADAATLAFTSTPPGATDDYDEDLWIYATGTRAYRRLSGAPCGQLAAAVGAGFVIWIDERRTTASWDGGDLYGYDLVNRRQFVIARTSDIEGTPSNLTLCGDELFWTILKDGDVQAACGARLVRDGAAVHVERL